MDAQKLKIALVLSSVPLRRLNQVGEPIGLGTACIINYSSKRILLTANHIVEEGNWAIELKYDFEKQTTALQPLGKLHSFKKFSEEQLKEIDFTFIEISKEIIPYYQIIKDDLSMESECYRNILVSSLDAIPHTLKSYGFHGQIRPTQEKHRFGQLIFSGENRLETGMTYIGLENDTYKFKLNHKHLGHENYKGCSGAPILDNDGNLVSLVLGGDIEKDIIFGFPIAKYRRLIDIALSIGVHK